MPSKALDPDRNLRMRGSSYRIRYELGGVERRKSLGKIDVRTARKIRDAFLQNLGSRPEGVAPEAVRTWQDTVEGYLALAEGFVADGKLCATTAERYQVSIIQITLAVAGDADDGGHTKPVPLSDITKATLLDFVEARRDEDRASSTILNDLTAWSRVFAYACGKGWCEHNAARSLTGACSSAPPPRF